MATESPPVATRSATRPPSQLSELELRGVSRAYGSHVALKPMDLTVRGGEFVALLGPSGCGKTTALNCLAGLLPLTAGEILLDGKRVDTVAPEKRGFGMVFQNYALFPHLTVRANVAFGLKMRGIGKAETRDRVDAVLHLVRLAEHAGKHPGQLSGGQQQRVAIARAIVVQPPLVLMDEPLSNLDAALRLEMRSEIRRIHQEFGLTTIYVTHDQEEALSLADRLVVLRDGAVSQVGTPAELYEHPASPHVAAFMGYRNLLSLTATSAGTAGGRGLLVIGTPAGASVPAEGRPVIVAIRPEDLHVVADGDPAASGAVSRGAISRDAVPLEAGADGAVIVGEAIAEVVEYHGRALHVQAVTAQGDRLHLRTSQPVRPGDPLRVAVAPQRALIFAGAGGRGGEDRESVTEVTP
jgi:putative spermidine/putrescine transport system ATP-binding protein